MSAISFLLVGLLIQNSRNLRRTLACSILERSSTQGRCYLDVKLFADEEKYAVRVLFMVLVFSDRSRVLVSISVFHV